MSPIRSYFERVVGEQAVNGEKAEQEIRELLSIDELVRIAENALVENRMATGLTARVLAEIAVDALSEYLRVETSADGITIARVP